MCDIVEYPNFLSDIECEEIINFLPTNLKKETKVVVDKKLINKLLNIVQSKLPEFTFTDHVTVGFTSKAIISHLDPKLDPRVTHRMYIYLKIPSKGGGTIFEDCYRIIPENNKAVIFDISLRHKGEEFPTGEIKKIVAFRMFKC